MLTDWERNKRLKCKMQNCGSLSGRILFVDGLRAFGVLCGGKNVEVLRK